MLPPVTKVTVTLMLLFCPRVISLKQDDQNQLSYPVTRCEKASQNMTSHCYALYSTPKSWFEAEGHELNDDRWKWISNEEVNYFSWDRNSFTVHDHGYCGSLTEESEYLKWIDFHCDIKLPYICKLKH